MIKDRETSKMKGENGKPRYGYTAWKYFAYMGVIGLIGLTLAYGGAVGYRAKFSKRMVQRSGPHKRVC